MINKKNKKKLTNKQIYDLTKKSYNQINLKILNESDEINLYPGIEIWKPIRQLNNKYYVSNLGRIKNNKQIIKQQKSKNGYRIFAFTGENGTKITLYIHHLVMEYFGKKQPNNTYQRDHIDGNKNNNIIVNLEWVTPSENMRRSYEKGLRKPTNCKSVVKIDVTTNVVIYIFDSIQEAANLSGVSRNKIRNNYTDENNHLYKVVS